MSVMAGIRRWLENDWSLGNKGIDCAASERAKYSSLQYFMALIFDDSKYPFIGAS